MTIVLRARQAVFGEKYRGQHDYVTLRRRYSHHRGAYGWCRKWRGFGIVLLIERNKHLGWRLRVYPLRRDHEPYWREENEYRIAVGWR